MNKGSAPHTIQTDGIEINPIKANTKIIFHCWDFAGQVSLKKTTTKNQNNRKLNKQQDNITKRNKMKLNEIKKIQQRKRKE